MSTSPSKAPRWGGRAREGILMALVAVALVAGGGLFLDRVVGVQAGPSGPAHSGPLAYSGAWYCPHGGGPKDWGVNLSITNPGSTEVSVRLQNLGDKAPAPARQFSVPAGRLVSTKVPPDQRGGATLVEYFGGWVSAGWVAVAGGKESGVAAEPCVAESGRRWLLPAGTTVEGQDSWIVVMNPFATEAVFTLELVTERRTVRPKALTGFVLPARRSVAVHLNDHVFGDRTVAGVLTVSIGRVAASTLGLSKAGGAWSVEGIPRPSRRIILPGGGGTGRADVPVLDVTPSGARFEVNVLGSKGVQAARGLADERLATGDARTETVTSQDLGSIGIVATEGGLVAAKRTAGTAGDVGAIPGLSRPGRAWLISSAAAGAGSRATVYLANPGTQPATVRLTVLTRGGPHPGRAATVSVPPGATVAAPARLLDKNPLGSVLAVAESGTFVPVEASYDHSGSGYSLSEGVRVPSAFVP